MVMNLEKLEEEYRRKMDELAEYVLLDMQECVFRKSRVESVNFNIAIPNVG